MAKVKDRLAKYDRHMIGRTIVEGIFREMSSTFPEYPATKLSMVDMIDYGNACKKWHNDWFGET